MLRKLKQFWFAFRVLIAAWAIHHAEIPNEAQRVRIGDALHRMHVAVAGRE